MVVHSGDAKSQPRRAARRIISDGERLRFTTEPRGGYSFETMICPFCRVDNDRVIDSRTSPDGLAIRRRRECLHCKRRFTTYERVEELSLKVVKKGGDRVPFEREKIKRGLEKACWKRPISDDVLDLFAASGRHDQIKGVIEKRFAETSDAIFASANSAAPANLPPDLIAELTAIKTPFQGFQSG